VFSARSRIERVAAPARARTGRAENAVCAANCIAWSLRNRPGIPSRFVKCRAWVAGAESSTPRARSQLDVIHSWHGETLIPKDPFRKDAIGDGPTIFDAPYHAALDQRQSKARSVSPRGAGASKTPPQPPQGLLRLREVVPGLSL